MLNKDQNKFQEFLQHYLPYNTWLETCYQAISSWDDKFFKGRTCEVLHEELGLLGFNEVGFAHLLLPNLLVINKKKLPILARKSFG